MRFLATDLEVALRSKCAATVAKAGSLTLPAKKLYEIVKSLPETDIRIAEDKSGVKVAADRFESRMQTLPREDFPTLPEAGTGIQRVAAANGAQGNGDENTVCDHRRGHPLFPERRAVRAEAGFDEPGRDRRPSSGARHGAARRQGREGRRRRSADPAEENARRARPAAARRRRRHHATSAARTICSSKSAAGC